MLKLRLHICIAHSFNQCVIILLVTLVYRVSLNGGRCIDGSPHRGGNWELARKTKKQNVTTHASPDARVVDAVAPQQNHFGLCDIIFATAHILPTLSLTKLNPGWLPGISLVDSKRCSPSFEH